MSRHSLLSRQQKRRKKKQLVKTSTAVVKKAPAPLTKGQRFALIDRRYSLEPLFETPPERLPAEEAVFAFIDAYATRLPVDHPFRDDLSDVRLAPDTLMELAKDYLLFDFAWKLEKLHAHALREREQYERLERAKTLSQQIKSDRKTQHQQALRRQKNQQGSESVSDYHH
jgi:hypothetical protein